MVAYVYAVVGYADHTTVTDYTWISAQINPLILHDAFTGTFPTTCINCRNTAMHIFAFPFVLDLLLKLCATAGLAEILSESHSQ